MKRSGSASLDPHPLSAAALGDRLAASRERLYVRALAAAREAGARGTPVIAWTAVGMSPVEPVALFGRGLATGLGSMLWERPSDGCSLVGIGSAWEFSANGADRFEQARAAWVHVSAGAIGDAEDSGDRSIETGPATGAPGPVLMGGFSFAADGPDAPVWRGFTAASLVLPRITFYAAGGDHVAVLTVVVHPDAGGLDVVEGDVNDCVTLLREMLRRAAVSEERTSNAREGMTREEITPAAGWKSLVAGAAGVVRRGDLSKVVVARALRVRGAALDPVPALSRLRADYPTCTIFAVARGGHCFLGATPERLVRVHDGGVSAMALAGSAPRGRTDDEDQRLGAALLASAKDRVEHAVVVDALRESLADACSAVTTPTGPSLLKVSNVQHLCTPISARLRGDTTILDLVGRLHPTPAVGGVPRQSAVEWIHRHEGLDRGWYAGPIGWLDLRGNGEFAVAIRSALLTGDEALLYAGCGIVADSDPEAEYEESRLKLRPLLAALGANGNA